MTDDSGESETVQAVKEVMAQLHPVPGDVPSAEPGVLRRPLDLPDDGPRATREPKKMSDVSGSPYNGQLRAIETRIDAIKEDHDKLSNSVEIRLSELHGDMVRQSDKTNERLDAIVASINGKGNGDFTKYAGIIAIIVGVATGIVSGFVTLENNSINSSIASQGSSLHDKIKSTAERVDNLERFTVPRAELEKRIGALETLTSDVRRTQEDHTKQLANLGADVNYIKSDVERIKSIAVSRSEIDGNKNDTINRINLLSNRVSEMSKDNSALPIVVENQKQIRSDLNELTRKFVTIPEYSPRR